jgi:hypothetical protein
MFVAVIESGPNDTYGAFTAYSADECREWARINCVGRKRLVCILDYSETTTATDKHNPPIVKVS